MTFLGPFVSASKVAWDTVDWRAGMQLNEVFISIQKGQIVNKIFCQLRAIKLI